MSELSIWVEVKGILGNIEETGKEIGS